MVAVPVKYAPSEAEAHLAELKIKHNVKDETDVLDLVTAYARVNREVKQAMDEPSAA